MSRRQLLMGVGNNASILDLTLGGNASLPNHFTCVSLAGGYTLGSGSLISTLHDFGTSAKDCVQATGALQPTLSTSGGKPCVAWGGFGLAGATYMTSDYRCASEFTFMAAITAPIGAAFSGIFVLYQPGQNDFDNGTGNVIFDSGALNTNFNSYINGGSIASNDAYAAGAQLIVYRLKCSTGDWSLRINNAAVASGNGGVITYGPTTKKMVRNARYYDSGGYGVQAANTNQFNEFACGVWESTLSANAETNFYNQCHANGWV